MQLESRAGGQADPGPSGETEHAHHAVVVALEVDAVVDEDARGAQPALLDHLGVDFGAVNVLQSDALRQGIKAYSDWPTIPQLYVKGEFVGGCDIVREMFEADELGPFLAERGIVIENV